MEPRRSPGSLFFVNCCAAMAFWRPSARARLKDEISAFRLRHCMPTNVCVRVFPPFPLSSFFCCHLHVCDQVGWAYNLWGQVEFRQEELEFRFGPALGAIAYAALSTALGVCIMVRGADKLDASLRGDRVGAAAAAEAAAAAPGAVNSDGGGIGSPGGAFHGGRTAEEEAAAAAADEMYRDAVRSFHARRLLVVVGGVSLVVGWAWEEAFDLVLEGLVGEKADAGTVLAKLALAAVSTAVVLGREVRAAGHGHHDGGASGGHAAGWTGAGGSELLEPLVATNGRDEVVL